MRAGQCKELSLDSRRIIAKLVVAIAESRPQAEVAAAFRACGAIRTPFQMCQDDAPN